MQRATSRSDDGLQDARQRGGGLLIEAWPRSMPLVLAAKYVGLSPSKWLELVAQGDAPQSVQLTPGRVAWYREHLDAWLDERAARGQDRKRPNTWDDFEP